MLTPTDTDPLDRSDVAKMAGFLSIMPVGLLCVVTAETAVILIHRAMKDPDRPQKMTPGQSPGIGN